MSAVNLRTRQTVSTVSLRHDPKPAVVKQGRPFLYDAALTSRHGDLSCATCHVFGDMDGLAWDLGDPAGPTIDYPVRLKNTLPLAEPRQALHPLKGPMAGDCDLTARVGNKKDCEAGCSATTFHGDRSAEPLLNLEELLTRYRRRGEPLTFTCVPPGDGLRSALDRDLNGLLDGDEFVGGSADANSLQSYAR